MLFKDLPEGAIFQLQHRSELYMKKHQQTSKYTFTNAVLMNGTKEVRAVGIGSHAQIQVIGGK